MTRIRRSLAPPSVTCAWVRERLAALALDSLSRAESARAALHLARCATCRREVRRERELLALLPQALEPCEPPPSVLADVLRRVHAARRPRRSLGAALGASAAAALLALGVLVWAPQRAEPLEASLSDPGVAVINLFVALDSPLSSRYEFRTVSALRFDHSVGRVLFRVDTGEWRLVVHGLPRPPHGAHYVLSAQVDGHEVPLGIIERWKDGVANLAGRSEFDLARTDRISLDLVGRATRVRLLDAIGGTW